MALDNYTNLKASIISWSHRQDIGDVVDDFILIAETEFYYNAIDPLRVREMEARDTSATNTTDRFLALPTDFLEARRLDVTVSTERRIVTYQTPAQMVIQTQAAHPNYFTVTDQIEFNRQPDEIYETNLQYYQTLPALDSTNDTNEILTKYPNVYLYGALWALFKWSRNTEEELKWKNDFLAAIVGANKSSMKGRYGPNPQMRNFGPTP